MGWITRRIAGSITFLIVSAILTAIAITNGWLTTEPTLTTTAGVVIFGTAGLLSLAVTSSMKRNDRVQQAWDDYNRAWQDYYAQMGYYRQR